MVNESDILALKARINELEDRLRFIYRKLELEYVETTLNPIASPQIQAALRSGNKIEAIKLYREMTGAGLAEAKAEIDKAEQIIR